MKTFLVNNNNPIPEWYKPVLIEVENGYYMEKEAAVCLKKLLADGRRRGYELRIFSAYRTPEYQRNLFKNSVKRYMEQGMTYKQAVDETARSIAEPEYSEHNTGLAVDLCEKYDNGEEEENNKLPEDDGIPKECRWLKDNCYKYGFIIRYPPGKEAITGIIYEPWHMRYVGCPYAKIITKKGITLEEYHMIYGCGRKC